MASPKRKSVLFVCLGNICRSVMSEAILTHMVAQQGVASDWLIDSAATSDYEIGSTPDTRTNQTLKKNKVPVSDHIARQIKVKDFENFYFIFGFDESNIRNLEKMKPRSAPNIVKLFGMYDPRGTYDNIIQDPYYSDLAAFEGVYEQCERSCEAFLESINS